MSFGDDVDDTTAEPEREARQRLAALLPNLSPAEIDAVLRFAVRLELARLIRLQQRRR